MKLATILVCTAVTGLVACGDKSSKKKAPGPSLVLEAIVDTPVELLLFGEDGLPLTETSLTFLNTLEVTTVDDDNGARKTCTASFSDKQIDISQFTSVPVTDLDFTDDQLHPDAPDALFKNEKISVADISGERYDVSIDTYIYPVLLDDMDSLPTYRQKRNCSFSNIQD